MKWYLSSKAYLFIFLCYLIGHLAYWASDTYVPFRTKGPATQTVATPGKKVKIEVPIERDITKKCSVLFSRYMYDSQGTYHDLMATRFQSYNGILKLHQINPNTVKFSFQVPEDASEGPATVVTQLAYMCNPLQAVWPMDYDMVIKIHIEKKP
jgi:hypothetical protein